MSDTQIPCSIMAGETFDVTLDLGQSYRASAWTSNLYISNDAGKYTISGTASSDLFNYYASGSTTAAYVPGDYTYTIIAFSGSTTQRVNSGVLSILPDVITASGTTSSIVKRTLDAIEALIMGRASTDVDSYTIGGRSLSKMNLTDLLHWRSVYATLYEAELAKAKGISANPNVFIRFRTSR